MDIVRAARHATRHVAHYVSDFAPLLSSAAAVTLDAVRIYASVVLYLLRPLYLLLHRLYDVVTPPLADAVRTSVIALTMQPRHVVIKELSAVAAVCAAVSVERHFRLTSRVVASYRATAAALTRRYRRLLAHVRAKSRLAAFALPHLIFIAAAAAFHYFLGRRVGPWLRSAGLVLTAFVWPSVRTIRLLYTVDVEESPTFSPSPPTAPSTPAARTIHGVANYFLSAAASFSTTPATPAVRPDVPAPTPPLNSSSSGDTHGPTATSSPVSRILSTLPSNSVAADIVRRRRRPKDADPLRLRSTSSAADDIENDGSSANGADRARTDNVLRPSLSTDVTPRPTRVLFRQRDDAVGDDRRNALALTAPRARAITKASVMQQLSDELAHIRRERRVLRFWVVLAAVWAVRCALWFICPAVLQRIVDTADVWLFYLVVWAQLGLTTGADVLYVPLAKFLHRKGLLTRAARRVASRMRMRAAASFSAVGDRDDPTIFDSDDDDDDSYDFDTPPARRRANGTGYNNSDNTATQQQLGLLLRIASTLRITDAFQSGQVWRFVFDSGLAVALFLVFALTPRPVTFVATIIAGVVVPCMRSAAALEADADEGGEQAIVTRRHNWLVYWSVYSLLDLVYTTLAGSLSWLPLWYHLKMAAIVWLQVRDFRGALTVLDWVMTRIGFVMSSVRRSPVTPKKRKRS